MLATKQRTNQLSNFFSSFKAHTAKVFARLLRECFPSCIILMMAGLPCNTWVMLFPNAVHRSLQDLNSERYIHIFLNRWLVKRYNIFPPPPQDGYTHPAQQVTMDSPNQSRTAGHNGLTQSIPNSRPQWIQCGLHLCRQNQWSLQCTECEATTASRQLHKGEARVGLEHTN